MKSFSFLYKPEIADFVLETFKPEDQVLLNVRNGSEKAKIPAIHVGEMDGLHLEVLARINGARKIVEIGTLAGYSGICLLRGGGKDARLWTFDISPEHAEVAGKHFEMAGVKDQVKTYVGPALEKLREIEKEGPFDLVFVDADKNNYPFYFAWAEKHLRKGGVLIGDNTFAFGMLGETSPDLTTAEGQSVVGLRDFNRLMAQKGTFRSTILPTGEGLTIGVKIRD